MSVRVEVDDDGIRPFFLLETGEMTFAELQELKRISGMTPVRVDEVRIECDPDAWLGILTVSYRRTDAATDESFWLGRKLLEIIEGIAAAVKAEQKKAEAEEKADKKRRPPRPAASAEE